MVDGVHGQMGHAVRLVVVEQEVKLGNVIILNHTVEANIVLA